MKPKIHTISRDSMFQNALFLMLSTGFTSLCGFFFWLIVARAYRPEQVGIASTLITGMGFIAYLSLLGFNSTFIRFLPKTRHRNEHVDTGLILVMSMALITSVVYVLIVPLVIDRLQILNYHWYFKAGFVLMAMCAAINLVTDSIFIAYRAARYNFLIDGVLASLSQLSLPLILTGLGAFGVFASVGIALCIAAAASIFCLIRKFHYRPRFKIDRQAVLEVRRFALGNYIANTLGILPTMVMPLAVLSVLGASRAGFYYLAFMMSNLLFAIAYAVANSLFAEGSYSEESLRKLIRKAAYILGGLLVPASIALAIIGPYVLQLFGREYRAEGRQLLAVLSLSGLFVAVYALCGVLLRITKQVKSLVLATCFYAAIITILTLSWVHKGLVWVGLAWLLGHLLTDILMIGLLINGQRRAR